MLEIVGFTLMRFFSGAKAPILPIAPTLETTVETWDNLEACDKMSLVTKASYFLRSGYIDGNL